MRFVVFGVVCTVLCVVNSVQASIHMETQSEVGFADGHSPPVPDVNLVFSSLPTTPSGDGTLTITLFGDFDSSVEDSDVDILAEGFSFGTVLDGNTTNDDFDHPTDDGNQYVSAITMSTTIDETDLQTLVSDGMFTLTLSFSDSVHNLDDIDQEFVEATIEYEFGDDPPDAIIPEPSSCVTFAGLALCFGLAGWWRRRRRRA